MYNLNMKTKLILITSLALLTNTLADHNHENSLVNTLSDNTKEYRENIHKILSKTSKKIDNFFFKENLESLSYDDSYALLELNSSYDQDNSTQFDQRFRIKLKLPRLEEVFHLEIESEEERETEDFTENKNSNSKNDDVSVALAYLKEFKEDLKLKAKAGIKVRTSYLDPFIKAEINKKIDFNKFDLILDQEVRLSEKKEVEATSFIQFNKNINNIYSLHNYNQYYWHSQNKYNSEFYNSVYLTQKLTNNSYLQYITDINTNNVDSELETKRYSVKVKYRHFIKDWIYFDTIPENYYSINNNFDSKYAIRFNLGVYFNKISY